MHTQIVVFDDGFDPLDVIAPLEVLHAAGASVELVSADGPRSVPSGMAAVSLRAVASVAPTDWLLVPGAVGASDAEITGRLAATLLTSLPQHLAAALADPAIRVATVCGGSLIPAMAGLIAGRAAVTHHDGVTSGLDVGLYLVEREIGPQAARAVERLLAYERRGVVWREPVRA